MSHFTPRCRHHNANWIAATHYIAHLHRTDHTDHTYHLCSPMHASLPHADHQVLSRVRNTEGKCRLRQVKGIVHSAVDTPSACAADLAIARSLVTFLSNRWSCTSYPKPCSGFEYECKQSVLTYADVEVEVTERVVSSPTWVQDVCRACGLNEYVTVQPGPPSHQGDSSKGGRGSRGGWGGGGAAVVTLDLHALLRAWVKGRPRHQPQSLLDKKDG